MSSSAGPAQVVVFTDFECPFCKRMDSVLIAIDSQFPGKIALSMIHFPLGGHAYARTAARVLECAATQGRALSMYHVLFASQSKFVAGPWQSLAGDARVENAAQFEMCIGNRDSIPRIEQGVALGQRLSLQGTPAVVVNGWLFDPALPETIEKAVVAAVHGKSPKP